MNVSYMGGALRYFPYYANLIMCLNVLKLICLYTSHIISFKEFSDRALQGGMGHCVIQGFLSMKLCKRVLQTTVWRFGTGDSGREKIDRHNFRLLSRSWDWRKNVFLRFPFSPSWRMMPEL